MSAAVPTLTSDPPRPAAGDVRMLRVVVVDQDGPETVVQLAGSGQAVRVPTTVLWGIVDENPGPARTTLGRDRRGPDEVDHLRHWLGLPRRR